MSEPSKIGDPMTDRQRVIFDVIRGSLRDRGYPPTLREIGMATGISSPNGVMCHLRSLEKKGVIRRDRERSRSITVLGGDGPGEDSRLLRDLVGLAVPLAPGHDLAPCTHAIYLTGDEVATLRRHTTPEEGPR